MTNELKRGEVLSFDDGVLTVKTEGHGAANGWATLAFHERQFEIDADGFQVVEIPPSELRALRDFLNRLFPAASATFEREAIAKCLFNTAMVGHAQWDDMTEANKNDWREKADAWISDVNNLMQQRSTKSSAA